MRKGVQLFLLFTAVGLLDFIISGNRGALMLVVAGVFFGFFWELTESRTSR